MAILTFLLHLTGATMLLMFAVRMVRTGIERRFGASFTQHLSHARHPLPAALAGLLLAMILQSSAAVALLVSTFAMSASVTFASGLAMILGGDLGSALIIQILTLDLEWLTPLLLALGGGLFIKGEQKTIRQTGRIILGIAFILISLRFLREAMEPIRDSGFLPVITDYLQQDYLTAFLVGTALAFIMHSSVAAILMFATLVAINTLPLIVGVSLLLGANLGSAFIPVWLTRDLAVAARRIPVANLFLRGLWALLVLFMVNHTPLMDYLQTASPAQTLVNTHIAFNFSLLILALPLCKPLARLFTYLLPVQVKETPHLPLVNTELLSALDMSVVHNPSLAMASLKRELLRMSEVVERMAYPLLSAYESGDKTLITELQGLDAQVNRGLSDIRTYASALPHGEMSKVEIRCVREMTEYAINLEAAGDIVAKRLLILASEKNHKTLSFSRAGWNELRDLHQRVMANMGLASNVLISDDTESARLLIEEKSEIARLERRSRKMHLKRLAEGTASSFESSDIHLETLRALRDLNSQISAVAYPILFRNGQLLETRLIESQASR